MAEHIGSEYVEVLPDARGFVRRFEEQTRGGMTEAGRRAGNEWQHGFQAGVGRPEVQVRADTSRARAELASLNRDVSGRNGLLGTLLALSPALVPLAGAAAFGGAALGSMGVQGVLAVLGIKKEIEDATAEGLKFSAGVNVIKSDLHDLEATAARGALSPFQQAVARLHADMPALNADLRDSSKVLGDIAGHVLGGLVGGERTFTEPLLTAERSVDKLAARFESWATGPGGERFAEALSSDFEKVEPVIEDVAGAIADVIAASNGPGLAIVDELGLFARTLDAIPVPVLSALTTGLVSLKIASVVTGLMDKLALSVTGVAVAEERAAVASTGLRGRLGGMVGFLGRASAGWLAFSIAADTAQQSTDGWVSSSDNLKRIVGTTFETLSDIGHLDLKGAWSDLFGSGAEQAANEASYVKNLRRALDDMYDTLEDHQKVKFRPGLEAVTGVGSILGTSTAQQGPTGLERIQRAAQKATDELTESLQKQNQTLITLAGHAGASQLATAYGSTASALQKQIDQTEKFLDLGGEEVLNYKGVSIGANTYRAALKATGGDLQKATGYIESHIDNLGRLKGDLADVSKDQQRLITYTSDLSTKYGLSSEQVDLYTKVLGINTTEVARNKGAVGAAEKEFGQLVHVLQNGDTALDGWLAAVDQWSKSADTVGSRAQLIGSALRASNGDTIAFQNTLAQASQVNQQFVTDLADMKRGVLNFKTGSLDYHNAAAGPLLQDLQAIQDANVSGAAAIYQHETALGHDKRAAQEAFNYYQTNTRGALIDEATRILGNADAAQHFIDKYFTIKNAKDLKKQIELIGEDKAQEALGNILADLDILVGRRWQASAGVDVTGSADVAALRGELERLARTNIYIGDSVNANGMIHVSASGHSGGGSYAVGGDVADGYFTVGEEGGPYGWELGHKSGPHVRLWSNRESRQITGWHRVPGYAGGSGGYGGYSGVDYRTSEQQHKDAQNARNNNNNGKQKPPAFDRSALDSFLSQLGITTNAFTQAKNELISALRQSKLSNHELARVTREANQLIRQSRAIARETERINKAEDYLSKQRQQLASDRQAAASERASVRSSILGLFDLGSAGVHPQIYNDVPAAPVTGTSILADLTAAANKGLLTKNELAKLKGKIPDALYRELADNAGQYQDQIAALSTSSRSTLRAISRQYGRLSKAGGAAGSSVAAELFGSKISNDQRQVQVAQALLGGVDPDKNPALARAVRHLSNRLFGAGQDTARGIARGLRSEKHHLVEAMHELAHELERTIRHDLKIKSPSLVMHEIGGHVGQGLVNGIIEQMPAVRAATSRLAGEIPFETSGTRQGRPGDGATFKVYGYGAEEVATALQRRLDHQQRLASV